MEKKKHDDTTISLHPLTFEEAIKELTTPKRKDSQPEQSHNTNQAVPESETSKKRTARRQ